MFSGQRQDFGQGGLDCGFFMALSPLYLLAVRLAWNVRANCKTFFRSLQNEQA
jgi:hypothetical protein